MDRVVIIWLGEWDPERAVIGYAEPEVVSLDGRVGSALDRRHSSVHQRQRPAGAVEGVDVWDSVTVGNPSALRPGGGAAACIIWQR